MIAHDALPALALLFLPARAAERRAQTSGGWSTADRNRYAQLLRREGLEIDIAVKTPSIVRDLDLLAALDRRHAVRVRMHFAAADDRLARQVEPSSARAIDLLDAVASLANEGLDVRVVVAPLRRGINDGEGALRRLVEAAREAGATDVELDSTKPGWTRRRIAGMGRWARRGALDGAPEILERLRLEHGFPQVRSGRG